MSSDARRTAEDRLRARETWAVTVERNGEQIVTLASNHLSGRDLSPEDERIIERCAEHLMAFIGGKRNG